ncbi:MAG: hypothetical protein ACSHXB_16320 [Sulfitobacter sp.]
MRAVLPSVMALAIGGVAAWLWWHAQVPPASLTTTVANERTATSQASRGKQSVVDFPTISDELLIEATTRPLFSASRTPEQYIEPTPEPEYEPEPEIYIEESNVEPERVPPPAPTMLVMSGYLVGDGGPRALMRNTDTQIEDWLSIGDAIEGWEIVSITSQDVTVTREGSKFVVKLYQ